MATTTPALSALTVLEGYILTCVRAGEKRPLLEGWPDLRLTTASKKIRGHRGNIGLLLGPAYPCGSGFLELDVDDAEALLEALDPVLNANCEPDAVIRSGGKNRGWKLLFWMRPHAWAWTWPHHAPAFRTKTEVRGARMQTVIPPSMVEILYEWVDPLPPLPELRTRAEARCQSFEARLFKAIMGREPTIATLTKGHHLQGYSTEYISLSSKSREREKHSSRGDRREHSEDMQRAGEHIGSQPDLWTKPEVAWIPILRAAHKRTYPSDGPMDDIIFPGGSGAAATEQSKPFRDPFEPEENPSYCLRRTETGEWRLRSHRGRDAAGACFMSVQQGFQALRTGRKPLRQISKKEHRRLTRELLAWLGLKLPTPADLQRSWWVSDSALGRIADAAFNEIIEQATWGRRVVLDCRRLGRKTNINFGGVSYALRLLCAIGLLSRELCNEDYPGKRPNRKQYSYQAEFDAVDQANGILADNRVDPDKPGTWRRYVTSIGKP